MGYGKAEIAALGRTIAAAKADFVLAATPVDLARLIPIDTPVIRVRYDFAEVDAPGLSDRLAAFLARSGKRDEAMHKP